MLLSELLTPERVRVPLRGASKEALLEELVGVLRDCGAVADAGVVLGAVRARERVLSTGVGSGVAIPHGKAESVPALAMAAGVTGGAGGVRVAGRRSRCACSFCWWGRTRRRGSTSRRWAASRGWCGATSFRERLIAAASPEEFMAVLAEAEEA